MNGEPLASPSLLERAWGRTPLVVKRIGYVGTVAAAIYAVYQAAPILEPIIPAHRAYARSVSHDDVTPLLQRVVEIQLTQNEDRRQRLIDETAKREIELQSDQAHKLPQYRALVQQRVDRIKSDLKTLDDKDNSLFKEQGKAKK